MPQPPVSTRPDLQREILRHKAAFNSVFPNWENGTTGPGSPTTQLQQRVEPLLQTVFAGIDRGLRAIDEIKENVTVARAKAGHLTPQAISQESNRAVREGADDYVGGLASATAAVDALSAEFARLGKVQRPTPVDAAQEAALGNLRTDLRMMLDPLRRPVEIMQCLAQVAGDASANGDELRTWFLSATEWPTEYLASRGEAGSAPQARHMISEAIAPNMGKERGQALTGYRLTEQGRDGLRRLVDGWLPSVWELEMVSSIEPLVASR